ncbi:MAG: hypothetical protein AAF960_05900 [Bacteroidota bacterium]
MKRILLIFFLLLTYIGLHGQQLELSNWREKTMNFAKDSIVLDSLPIVPNSVRIQKIGDYANLSHLPSITYNLLILNDSFFINNDVERSTKFILKYRVFPFDFRAPVRHLDTLLIAETYEGNYIGFDYTPEKRTTTTATLFDNSGLQYSGSFARGISFGNSQNLVLNSQFNLQLSGKLGNDTEVVAALTDENIPLQAEGNTQQLQDFDQVFIQIKQKNSSLTAGDYEISTRDHYFMQYYKKLQGATFATEQSAFKTGKWTTQGSFAISRGLFSRNIIPAIEGNQGPYRLTGSNGEQFIIVLAGTERVFLDGILTRRGIEEDYIIDYNRGELVFTNKKLITQNSRIIVEFEYLDQTFQRSLYAVNSELKTEKNRFYFGLFSQQDSKNAVGDIELSSAERMALQNIGDDVANAVVSGVDTLENGFQESNVQYELRDTFYTIFNENSTIGDTIFTEILIYSINPSLAKYTARFTQVGQGNGNYRLTVANNANGRTYEWVAPDELTGLPQGDFEPIQRLVAPEKQQLYTIGTELTLGENSFLRTEVALSNTDLNRLSSIDQADNLGTALFGEYGLEKPLGKKGWALETNLKYEWVQRDFRALNPYRNAEFNRDWNVNPINNRPAANEQIGKGKIRLTQKNETQIDYQYSTFRRSAIYEGTKHDFDVFYKKSGYDIRLYGSLLATTSETEASQFFRPRIDISKRFKKWRNWQLGVYGERERNEIRNITSDTLKTNGFYWDLYRIYLKSPENRTFQWQMNYARQTDFRPKGVDFLKSTVADEVNINGHWNQKRASQLKWNFSYRKLAIADEQLTNQTAQETYLGRLDYALNLWRGAFRWNTNYEIGSGQEAKVEFQFIKVNKGEGTFVWEATEQYDLNGDSIPQINEFVVAPFQDQANYVRINTFTNDFIRTNNVLLNQSLRLTPRAIWNGKKGVKKMLSKFSTLSTLRINRKVNLDRNVSAWNPFDLTVADTNLVTISSAVRNVLFFNRNHPVYDCQMGQTVNRNRNVQTTGFESRKNNSVFFRSRWNITPVFSNEINVELGNRSSDSELFDNRDFDIDYRTISPKFIYLPTPKVEATFSYEYQKAENQLTDFLATATFHELKLEAQYNRTEKLAFKSDFSFVNIAVVGSTNPTLELTLLEGLRKGQNFLWGLTLSRQLANNVQMSLRYEGRKTGDNRTVHLGSAQVRATF